MKIKKIYFQCGPFNISMEAEQQVQDLLFNLYADFYTFKSASCLPPCKTVGYKAFHKSYDAKSGRYNLHISTFADIFLGGYSMYLIFDQTVDLYKSNLVVDTFTLFTHVGGEMGFCKEILWILFTIFNGFEYVRRYITSK